MKKIEFEIAKRCCVCHDLFTGTTDRKVMDHDHTTGKYLGAVCNACNFKRQCLLFHNA